jgi:phosphatidylglycerophosphatase A
MGLLVVWAMSSASLTVYILITVLSIAGAIWISEKAEDYFGHDGRQIVLDEIVGIMVTMAAIPFSLLTGIVGFALFRIFDIIKVFPANYAQRLRGGPGVVLDDIAAAVYANILLRCFALILEG